MSGPEVIGASVTKFHEPGTWGIGTAASQELSHAFIVPNLRGRGFGTQMLRTQIDHAVRKGGKIWSLMQLGKKELDKYRKITDEIAATQSKSVESWTGDGTTESCSLAYIPLKNGEVKVIITKKRPNSVYAYKVVVMHGNWELHPTQLVRSHILKNLSVRKTWKDYPGSMSVNLDDAEFDNVLNLFDVELAKQNLKMKDELTPDGQPLMMFSVNVLDTLLGEASN